MKLHDKIRVVLAADCRLLLECLRFALTSQENIKIVGEAQTSLQLFDIMARIEVDVILMNLEYDKVDGIEIISAIKQRDGATKVLLLPSTIDEDTLLSALKYGAKGYLTKNIGIAGLVQAINAVHMDEIWIERKLIVKHFDNYCDPNMPNESEHKSIKDTLTNRELDVLRLLAHGFTNKEIAGELFISEKTVKCHVGNIFKKLNVSRRLQAILYGIKEGIC